MTDAQNPPPSNFRRLVLLCIKADFDDQIFVGKRLTRSTHSIPFDKSQISKFYGNFKIYEK